MKGLHMKRFVMLLLYILTGVSAARGQGGTTVNFSNFDVTQRINAPFYDADGVSRLSGANFWAALYWGPFETPDGMTQVGPAQAFRTGGQAGYWIPANRTIIPVSPGQPIFVQVRFWDSQGGTHAFFEQAYSAHAKVGFSDVLRLTPAQPGQTTPLWGLRSTSLIGVFPLLRLGERRAVSDVMAVPNGLQLGALCGLPVGRMRWFHLTFANPGEAVIDTEGSSIDTVLSVFTSCLLSSSACAPVVCTDGRAVRFQTQTDVKYAVAIGGNNGATGTLQVAFSMPVALKAERSPDQKVEISWPAEASHFELEVTTNLVSWEPTGATPTVIGNRSVVELNPEVPRRLYRLKGP